MEKTIARSEYHLAEIRYPHFRRSGVDRPLAPLGNRNSDFVLTACKKRSYAVPPIEQTFSWELMGKRLLKASCLGLLRNQSGNWRTYA